jgi:hypothetical protein
MKVPGITAALDSQGRVRLEGLVDTPDQKTLLMEQLSATVGKDMVIDGLSKTIVWRASEASAALVGAGLSEIQVRVEGSENLAIMGSVDSAVASRLAEQLVRASGARYVRNALVVAARQVEQPVTVYSPPPAAQQIRPVDPRAMTGSAMPAAMLGTWGGRVQVGFLFKATYAVQVELRPGRAGGVVGTATYARIRKGVTAHPVECRSTLVLDQFSEGVARMQERVQGSGDWLCAASGRMAVILNGNELALGWDRQGYNSKPMRGQISRDGSTTDGQAVTLRGN